MPDFTLRTKDTIRTLDAFLRIHIIFTGPSTSLLFCPSLSSLFPPLPARGICSRSAAGAAPLSAGQQQQEAAAAPIGSATRRERPTRHDDTDETGVRVRNKGQGRWRVGVRVACANEGGSITHCDSRGSVPSTATSWGGAHRVAPRRQLNRHSTGDERRGDTNTRLAGSIVSVSSFLPAFARCLRLVLGVRLI